MRKLIVRKYESDVEFARDLYAIARVISKNRKILDQLKKTKTDKQDAVSGFSYIVASISSLDDVLPNMSEWLKDYSINPESKTTYDKLHASMSSLNQKSARLKMEYVTIAKKYSGSASKKFRSACNSIKINIDSELSGLYDNSEMNVFLMPSSDGKFVVNAAVMEYTGLKDNSGFQYPKYFSYIYETEEGSMEVRSSPMEILEYHSGQEFKNNKSAVNHILGRLKRLDIHPVKNNKKRAA